MKPRKEITFILSICLSLFIAIACQTKTVESEETTRSANTDTDTGNCKKQRTADDHGGRRYYDRFDFDQRFVSAAE